MRQLNNGISGFTRGLRQTTWQNPSLQVRLAGFVLAVAAVALLIVGIDSNIWREQRRLEQGFAAIKAEKFYLPSGNRGVVEFATKQLDRPADVG